MVDAVAARTAPSPHELQQRAPSSGSVATDGRSALSAAMAPAVPDRNDAVILDLSDQARAVLAHANTEASASGDQAEDLAGLIRFEERFKLMTEYTALQQELAWLSDQTAAYALDKTFGGARASEDGGGGEASGRVEIDRHMQRREELMPRFAELARMLRALPGQEN